MNKKNSIFDGSNALGLLLYRAGFLIRSSNLKRLREKGHTITPEKWMLLYELDKNEDISQKDLGHLIFKDKTNVTRLIDQLEKEGYVKRKVDENDRRKFKLRLTAKGKKIKNSIIDISKEVAEENYKVFTKQEKKECTRLVKKLYEHLMSRSFE